jgi:hypothetical protein
MSRNIDTDLSVQAAPEAVSHGEKGIWATAVPDLFGFDVQIISAFAYRRNSAAVLFSVSFLSLCYSNFFIKHEQ